MNMALKVIGAALILILLLAALAAGIGNWRFNRLVSREVKNLFAQMRTAEPAQGPEQEQAVITEEMLEELPPPVQRYLRYSSIVGRPRVHAVRLRQTGRFRQTPDAFWMAFRAEQYYTVHPPGFIWTVNFPVLGLPFLSGRDRYQDGAGNMQIKVGSVFTVADESGKDMDQGTMMRYLNEIMWFPTAYLSDGIHFSPIDAHSAHVTFTDRGRSAGATLHFDDEGKLTNFVARRYYSGTQSYQQWETPIMEYGEYGGLRLPRRGQGVWKLPEGDYAYIDLVIDEIEYDRPEPY